MDLKYYICIKNSRDSYAGQLKVYLANLLISSESIQSNSKKGFKTQQITFAISLLPPSTKVNIQMQTLLCFQIKVSILSNVYISKVSAGTKDEMPLYLGTVLNFSKYRDDELRQSLFILGI